MPPPTYAPAQGGPPATQPKKRNGCLIAFLVVLGVVVLLGVLFTVCSVAVFQNAEEIQDVAEEAEDVIDDEIDSGDPGTGAAIGEPATDGKFEFTVTDFECGQKRLGSGPFASEAQGEYCVAQVTVENVGDEPQFMDQSSQYLYIDGNEYTPDSDAILALDESESFFLEEINPGLSVTGVIAWDVPPGSSPSHLILHDSPFSGGATIKL